MKRNKSYIRRHVSFFLLLALAFTLAASLPASAAGTIDTGRSVSFRVVYMDGSTPITGTQFQIFRVADVDEFAHMAVTGQFSSYPIPPLGTMTDDAWKDLALTLQGYAQRDSLSPLRTETIGANGDFTVSLLPGLYLFCGEKKTVQGKYYTPTPFLIFLPAANLTDNTWDYETAAEVKFTNKQTDTLKVLKIWKDAGFESGRPDSVTVQLLCDGEVYDTRQLSQENNWRYEWQDLNPEHEWLVVEKEVEGYYTKVSLEGITFTVTNRCNAFADPPVAKKITGDTPPSNETFSFVFQAENDAYPMPEGSTGSTKKISITGAGTKEIGKIVFSKPGVYVYTLKEEDTGAAGYTYDKTTYTLTFNVTMENDEMVVREKVTDSSGNTADAPVFTNRYTAKGKLPQTGALWWPVPVLLCAGLLFCIVGFLWRKQRGDDNEE